MIGKKKINKEVEIDKQKVNDVIGLSKNILKILFLLLIIAVIYIVTILFKEWKIMPFIFTVIKILSPLFIGILIAWLFSPFVNKMQKKGLKRGLSAALIYVIFIGGIVLLIATIIPLLSGQIDSFAKTIPNTFDSIQNWISGIFDKLGNIKNFDSDAMKYEVFQKLEEYGQELTNSLPTMTVNIVKSFFSGLGVFAIGLVIGFFLIISFEGIDDDFVTFLPQKFQKDTRNVMSKIDLTLRRFVKGTLLDSTLILIVTSIGFWAVGLKAPALFGLFCGVTNIIPYAGPYIGGVPAVIVAFSQNTVTGILVLIIIVITQFVEGNFFQPIIMSKTTKLHPVTILLGLLVFGYFWGILGMVVSTPIIAVSKTVFQYFETKYGFLNFNN